MSVPLDAVVAVRQTDAGGVTAALVVNGHASYTRSVAEIDLQIRRKAPGTQTDVPAYEVTIISIVPVVQLSQAVSGTSKEQLPSFPLHRSSNHGEYAKILYSLRSSLTGKTFKYVVRAPELRIACC